MGCCICRPKVEVTEDPTVLFHTRTKRAALSHGFGTEVLNHICGGGILYVRDGTLSFEATCGSRLYCKCFRKTWALSNIHSVEFVENDSITVLQGNAVHIITMNPGLKIRISGRGSDAVFYAGVPDAAGFQRQLNDQIGRSHANTRF